MADEFKTFDKEPIVSVVRISRWSFGIREIILAAIAGLLLVMCLVFAGLFGNANGKLLNEPSASAIVGQSYCTDAGCMRTAARAASLLNKSVDPCENFYQFACGNYKKIRRVFPNEGTRNVMEDLREENEDRIIDVLEQPISAMHDWAAERKLKKFFESCNDMYARENQRGLPVLTRVIPALGGWKLLGTWDASTWDLNTVLKKVQADLWTDALYAPRVVFEEEKGERRIIRLESAGTGKWMQPWWYTGSFYQQIRDDYKKFIRRVGSLLFRDAQTMMSPPQGNSSLLDDLLDEFVNDTFTVEKKIAELDSLSYTFWDVEVKEKIRLGALTTQTNSVIDWTTQISYLFNTAGISGNTQVGIQGTAYFEGLSAFLSSLPEEDMKRMLHNYFIWRVMENYVQELSFEYIHANREVYVDIYGRPNFLGVYKYCFHLSRYYMDDALNHLYIKQFLSKENKDTAHEISDNIRSALKTQISKTPWMDDATRTYAQEKLDLISFKIGYPDWMANQGEIDDMYTSLVINASDFMGNLVRLNQFRRASWNAELQRRGTLHEEWAHAAFTTNIMSSIYWREIAAPAGVLQFPIYDAHQPHYSTFGSLGAMMGLYLHRFIDEWGKMYDKNGDFIIKKLPDGSEVEGSWWSESTESNYKPVEKCVKEVYSNITRQVQELDGNMITIHINASFLSARSMTYTNGIRLALMGYQDWVQAKGLAERMIPGLDMNWDQMVFLATAQTHCEVSTPFVAYLNSMYMGLDTEHNMNMAMGQLEEFSRAFSCKRESKMNHARKCEYY